MSAIMSGLFIARSGWIGRWTLPIRGNFTTTLTSGACLFTSSASYTSRAFDTRRSIPWLEWLGHNPTSAKDIQTVYDVCMESRVFAPTTQRPLHLQAQTHFGKPKKIPWGDTRSIQSMFRNTEGLRPQDWEARNIKFPHAVEIAKQLQLQNHFSGKDLSIILKDWPQFLERAQRLAAGAESAKVVSKLPETIGERLKALKEGVKLDNTVTEREEAYKEERKGLDMGSGARHVLRTSTLAERKRADQARRTSQQGYDNNDIESMQADHARRILRQRKKAEQASDAEEGIKSKRRPLRLAATSNGVPLTFENMDKLRRVERRGREIVVDKEVRQRTREATVEQAQQKRNEARRANSTTMNNTSPQQDQHSSKERRSEAALEKIKVLADKNAKVLEAVIKKKERILEQDDLPTSRRKTAERQLKRAKQALAMHEWDAGRRQSKR